MGQPKIIIINEVKPRKMNIICCHLYVESKKKKIIQMNLFIKHKQTQ